MADPRRTQSKAWEEPERLARRFFQRPTLTVAQELLGCLLVHRQDGEGEVAGWISETEAYIGADDLACHGRHGRTDSNRSMWGPAGHAYVYFTYGIHWMLNLVTEEDGFPAAVLLRAVVPFSGLERIRQRRRGRPHHELTDGPAKLCQAFAIDGSYDGLDICQPQSPLIALRGQSVPEHSVTRGPRVGLNNVPEPWRSKPWRLQVDKKLAEGWTNLEGE